MCSSGIVLQVITALSLTAQMPNGSCLAHILNPFPNSQISLFGGERKDFYGAVLAD